MFHELQAFPVGKEFADGLGFTESCLDGGLVHDLQAKSDTGLMCLRADLFSRPEHDHLTILQLLIQADTIAQPFLKPGIERINFGFCAFQRRDCKDDKIVCFIAHINKSSLFSCGYNRFDRGFRRQANQLTQLQFFRVLVHRLISDDEALSVQLQFKRRIDVDGQDGNRRIGG